MKLLGRTIVFLSSAVLMVCSAQAHADTICTNNTCTVHVVGDPNAPTSNFGGGTSAQVGYTITITDDGTSLKVTTVSDSTPAGIFQNLYFDINPGVQGSSNLGFEATNNRAFIPGVDGYQYFAANSGYSSVVDSTDPDHVRILTTIPNTFFTNDLFGRNLTTDGKVSLHLSQTFSYSVAGGGSSYPAPTELGIVSLSPSAVAPTPEPSAFLLLGTGLVGIGGVLRKRITMS